MNAKRVCTLAVIILLIAAQRAWSLSCAGIPGGSGDYYFIGRPILNVSYNPLTGKTYMTDDFGSGRVWEGSSSGVAVIDNNDYPYDIVVIPATNMVYYTLGNNRAVKVYDIAQGRAIMSIAVGDSPKGIVYSSPTKRLYVANSKSNSVSVIDANPASGSYHRVIATISAGSWPWTLAVNETRGRVYVGNKGSKNITVIREDTLRAMSNIFLNFEPGEMTASKTTNKVYVINENSSVVTVINANTDPGAVQTTFTAGSDPWGIVVNPLTHSIFVTDKVDHSVTWFRHDAPPNGATYSILDTFGFGTALRGVDVNQATDQFIVASEDGVLFDGLPPCDRRYLDKCLDMRKKDLVDDAAVESFLECYFHQ
jgi:YVTN family beta-propeller protein